MKTRKLASKQTDFFSKDKDILQWSLLKPCTRDQAENLLSQLMLSVVGQKDHTIKEDHHVQN